MGGWDKSDDNGGHAGVHHVGISSIVISMLIDDTLMLVTVKFRSVVGTRYSTLRNLTVTYTKVRNYEGWRSS